MATTISSNYLNRYERLNAQLRYNEAFSQEAWDNAADTDNLAAYAQAVSETTDEQFEQILKDYQLNYASDTIKSYALLNEKYGDKTNSVKRTRVTGYVNGVAQTEDYYASDYDYTKEMIMSQGEAAKTEYLAQVAEEQKESLNGWAKAGATIAATVGEIGVGLVSALDSLITFFGGIGNGISTAMSGGSFSEGYVSYTSDDSNYVLGSKDLQEALDDYESSFTVYKNTDGTDTGGFSTFVQSIMYSAGQMLPSVAIGFAVGGPVGAIANGVGTATKVGTALLTTAKVARTVAATTSFYASMAADNTYDTVQYLESQGYTYSTAAVMGEAMTKAVFQAAEELLLDKFIGGSVLDNMVLGTSLTKGASKTLTKSGLKRMLKDAVKEGVEEVVQDTSDAIIDNIFGMFCEGFGEITSVDFSSLTMSFLAGSVMSLGGHAFKLATTKKIKTGIKDVKITTKKNGETKTTYKYNKLNKIASLEYGITMQSLAENANKVLNIAKKAGKTRIADTNNFMGQQVEGKKNIDALDVAISEIYLAYKMVATIYNTDPAAFNKANNLLTKLQSYSESKNYLSTNLEETMNGFLKAVESGIGAQFTASHTEVIKKKLEEAGMHEMAAAINKDGTIAAGKLDEASEKKLQKLIKGMNDKVTKIIVTRDGKHIVINEDIVFVPLKQLQNTGDTIFDSIAEETLVNALVQGNFKGITISDITDIYREVSGKSDATDHEAALNLFFNESFFKIVLSTANQSTYKLLASLSAIEKASVPATQQDNAYKTKVIQALNMMRNALTEYLIDQDNADMAMVSADVLSKEDRKRIAGMRWCRNLYKRVTNPRSAVKNITDADWRVLEHRVNAMAISAAEKEQLLLQLHNKDVRIRTQAMDDIADYYQGIFSTNYDGKVYMPDTSIANRTLNAFMQERGLTLADLSDTTKINDDTQKYIKEKYTNVTPETVFQYYNDIFTDQYTNGTLTIEQKNGYTHVIEKKTRIVKGYSEYYNLAQTNAFNKPKSLKDLKMTVDINPRHNSLTKLLSQNMDPATAAYLTVNDMVNDPDVLSDDIKQDIAQNYGEVNPYTTYLYLQNFIANETKGKMSIITKADGTYTIGQHVQMQSVLKNNGAIDFSKALSIKDIINEKYLFGRLGEIKVHILNDKDNKALRLMLDDSIAAYDSDSNTIVINTKKINSESKAFAKFSILHEFQHALQDECKMNNGFDATFMTGSHIVNGKVVPKMSEAQQRAIAIDVQKHCPELFALTDVPGSKESIKKVQDIIYYCSGEAQAYGQTAQAYIPFVTNYEDGAITLTTPWGTKYQLGDDMPVSLVYRTAEKDIELLSENNYASYVDYYQHNFYGPEESKQAKQKIKEYISNNLAIYNSTNNGDIELSTYINQIFDKANQGTFTALDGDIFNLKYKALLLDFLNTNIAADGLIDASIVAEAKDITRHISLTAVEKYLNTPIPILNISTANNNNFAVYNKIKAEDVTSLINKLTTEYLANNSDTRISDLQISVGVILPSDIYLINGNKLLIDADRHKFFRKYTLDNSKGEISIKTQTEKNYLFLNNLAINLKASGHNGSKILQNNYYSNDYINNNVDMQSMRRQLHDPFDKVSDMSAKLSKLAGLNNIALKDANRSDAIDLVATDTGEVLARVTYEYLKNDNFFDISKLDYISSDKDNQLLVDKFIQKAQSLNNEYKGNNIYKAVAILRYKVNGYDPARIDTDIILQIPEAVETLVNANILPNHLEFTVNNKQIKYAFKSKQEMIDYYTSMYSAYNITGLGVNGSTNIREVLRNQVVKGLSPSIQNFYRQYLYYYYSYNKQMTFAEFIQNGRIPILRGQSGIHSRKVELSTPYISAAVFSPVEMQQAFSVLTDTPNTGLLFVAYARPMDILFARVDVADRMGEIELYVKPEAFNYDEQFVFNLQKTASEDQYYLSPEDRSTGEIISSNALNTASTSEDWRDNIRQEYADMISDMPLDSTNFNGRHNFKSLKDTSSSKEDKTGIKQGMTRKTIAADKSGIHKARTGAKQADVSKRSYVSKERAKGTNLEKWGYTGKQMAEGMITFIKDFDEGYLGDTEADDFLLTHLKTGQATTRDVEDYLRTVGENMSDQMFHLINKSLYHNKYIKSPKQLGQLVDDSGMYYAARMILRLIGKEELILNADTPDILDTLNEFLLKLAKSDDATITMANGKKYTVKSLLDILQNTADRFDSRGISKKMLRRLWMQYYDGKASTAGAIAGIANWALLSERKVTGEISTTSADAKIEGKGKGESRKADGDAETTVIDQLADTSAGEFAEEIINSIPEEKYINEIIRMGLLVDLGIDIEDKQAIARYSQEDVSKLSRRIIKTKAKLEELPSAKLKQYLRAYYKKLTDTQRKQLFLLSAVVEGTELDSDQKHTIEELQAIAKKSLEESRNSKPMINSMRSMLATIRNIIPRKMWQYIYMQYKDIVTRDLKLNTEKLKQELRPGSKQEVYKSADDIQWAYDRVKALATAVKQGEFDTVSVAATKEKLNKITKQLSRVKAQRDMYKEKAKQKMTTIHFEVSDETITVDTDLPMPAKLNAILDTEFNQTEKTQVKFWGDEDASDKTDAQKERHVRMNYSLFLDNNAKNLAELTQSEAYEIGNYYHNTVIIPGTNKARQYAATRLYLTHFILEKAISGEFNFDSEFIAMLQNDYDTAVSIPAAMLAAHRTILQKFSGQKYLLKSLADYNKIEIDSADLEAIYDAMSKGDIKQAKRLKEQAYDKALVKYVQQKGNTEAIRRSFLEKIANFERMCMLSSPGTWARNFVSNVTVKVTDNVAAKIGSAMTKLFPNKFKAKQNREGYTGQYKIVGTKVTAEAQAFVNSIKDNKVWDLFETALTKYDNRVTTNKNTTGTNALQALIKEAISIELLNKNNYNNLFFDWCNKGLSKVLNDNPFIRSRAEYYLGRIIVEDNLTTKQMQLNNKQALQCVVTAWRMAAQDYMHKTNIFNSIEKTVREKLGVKGWFVYKQFFPFVSTAWSWFNAGLDYSPVGLVKGIINYARAEQHIAKYEANESKGDFSGTPSEMVVYKAIRQLGKGAMGTVGVIIGCILVGMGKVGLDEEDDKYKLRFGNTYIDISSLFGSQGILMGMAITQKIRDGFSEDDDVGDKIWDVFKLALDVTLTDSIMDDLVETFRYSDSVGDYIASVPNTIASMFVPNFLKTLMSFAPTKSVQYDDGILGTLEKFAVKNIPLIAYAMPKQVDPYTGEVQYPYHWDGFFRVLNKLLPIDIAPYNMSDTELIAATLDVSIGQLSCSYTVNDEKVKLSSTNVTLANQFYGQLNKSDYEDFINNKTKYKVQLDDGSYKELTYKQMTDKQKKTVLKRIASQNSTYAKIYILTQNGYKYYASDSEYKTLKKLGISNVYKETKKLSGFVKS